MDTSHNSAYTIALLCLVSLLSAAAATRAANSRARNNTAVVGEIVNAESLCRAQIELYQAQLEFARWRSRQLEALRENGHASWLEFSRAKILVKRLAARLDSSQHFLTFLLRLREIGSRQTKDQQQRGTDSPRLDARTADLNQSPSAWPVSWVGGERLSGTIAHRIARVPQRASGAHGPSHDSMSVVRKDVADAKSRLTRLNAIADRADVAGEITRAKLQLAMTRARLRVAEALRESASRPAVPPNRSTVLLTSLPDGDLDPGTSTQVTDEFWQPVWRVRPAYARAMPEPTRAALKVAAAEARAEGALHVARAILDYQAIRLDAARELYAHGCGTKRDVQEAEQRADEARTYLEQVRTQRRRSRETYKQLQRKAQQDPLHDPAAKVVATGWTGADDALGVRYQIRLKFSQATMRAEHLGWNAESDVERQLLRRLVATGKAHASALRERDLARARLALAEGFSLACAEREEVLKLEQQRLLEEFPRQQPRDRFSTPGVIANLWNDDFPGLFSNPWFLSSALSRCLPAQFRRFGAAAQIPSFLRRAMIPFRCRPTTESMPTAYAQPLVGNHCGFRCLPIAACVAILDESPGARPWLIRRFGQVLDVWGRPRSRSDACCPVPWYRRVSGRRDSAITCRDSRTQRRFCRTSVSLFANPSRWHRQPIPRAAVSTASASWASSCAGLGVRPLAGP